MSLNSGCIGVAVHGVAFVGRKLNPPQPVLHGSATFFGGALETHAYLRPVGRSRLDRLASLGSTQEDAGPEQAADVKADGTPKAIDADKEDDDKPKDRMAVWLTFVNRGPVTLEVTVLSADSPLGQTLPAPRTIALATNQDIIFRPFKSPHPDNLKDLEVTVTVKKGEVTEVQKVALEPFIKPDSD